MHPCRNSVLLSDRGFRYGQHLFETLAVREGRMLFFEEHWERLVRAAARHHFPVADSWHEGLRRFFKQTSFDDGVVRIYLTAGEGAPGSPIVTPQLFVFWEEALFPSEQDLEKGIALVSLEQPSGTFSWGEKTGNYWEHLRALEVARSQGAAEGLIFDAEGYLISASMANVFLWLEEDSKVKLITPPQRRGARDGVVRAWVGEHATDVCERDITRDDIGSAVAAVITNSRLGVMPVATLDGRTLPGFSLALQKASVYMRTVIDFSVASSL